MDVRLPPHVSRWRSWASLLCLGTSLAACGSDPRPANSGGGDGGSSDDGSQGADGAGQGGDGRDGTAGTDGSDAPAEPVEIVATLRTLLGNRYLGSEGDTVVARATSATDSERFTLVDLNGAPLSTGDTVELVAMGDRPVQAGSDGALAVGPSGEGFVITKLVGEGEILSGERVGLKAPSGWLSAQDGGGSSVAASGAELRMWETLVLEYRTDGRTGPDAPPDFGPNTLIFDPTMSPEDIQGRLDGVFGQMESNHFGAERYALLFQPGTYDADVNVGFYTQAVGLGLSPDNTTIRGAVHAEADWFQGNATQNFWRGAENLAVEPEGGTDRWAVSQAAPMRRMHIRGDLVLDDNGWASGGLLADSVVDGQVNSGTQQQWLTRTSEIGSWAGANWNMVFVGVDNAPSAASWPNPPHTVVERAPVLREKPYLRYDGMNGYGVVVPALDRDLSGTSWSQGVRAESILPIASFHVARAGVDSAATLNEALGAGKNLLFTPGIYELDDTLRVERADTVVLGLGLATLIPTNGNVAMRVSDVDGVKIVGILFDAGEQNSSVLLQVGPEGSSADHAADPTSLHDVFFRVGGAAVGKAETSLEINSDDVLGDHFWIWRADHGAGVGWDTNTAANGLIVNGDDVTIYGLFVEHFQGVQTQWNGNGGRVYFYQSEIPYDPPDQASWKNGSANGFASYEVADTVESHEAHGLGIYCFFNVNPSVKLESAIEVPEHGLNGAMFHHMTTVSLGGNGEITHVISGWGDAARAGNTVVRLAQ